MKEFFKYFKNFNKKEINEYNIRIADPITRFCAFIVDSFIIYSILALFIFIVIKKDMIPEDIKNDEASFSIDANNNISDMKNVSIGIENGEKVLNIKSKNERIEDFNKIVSEKIYNNTFCRYFILLFPILYNILYLLTKKRATIGQQLFGLMVITKTGNNLTFNDIINRVFLFTLCKIIFIAPFTIIIPVFVTQNKTTLYDYFTNTYVIKL